MEMLHDLCLLSCTDVRYSYMISCYATDLLPCADDMLLTCLHAYTTGTTGALPVITLLLPCTAGHGQTLQLA